MTIPRSTVATEPKPETGVNDGIMEDPGEGSQVCDPSTIPCPACGSALSRCPGNPKMPASRDYWRCNLCDLSGHVSRLLDDPEREALAKEYIDSLRCDAKEGRAAQLKLEAIRYRKKQHRPNAGVALVIVAVVAGAVFGGCLGRRCCG